MAPWAEMRSADLLMRRLVPEMPTGWGVDVWMLGLGTAHTVPAYLWPQVRAPTVIPCLQMSPFFPDFRSLLRCHPLGRAYATPWELMSPSITLYGSTLLHVFFQSITT